MDAEVLSTTTEPAGSNRELRAPPLWVCGLLIGAAKIALKLVDLRRMLRWMNACAGVKPSEGVDPSVVAAVERAVALAAALYPGRALCLEQSLVLYYFLRRRAINATFRIGVQAYPFAAHAWVEYRGQPVNDVEEHVKWFAPLPELPA
jgi:transglutaminase superfamily protein